MAAKKNTARKKKRISKHVLKAKEGQGVEGSQVAGGDGAVMPPVPKPKNKSKSNKKNAKVKDPSEAASYLSSWKHREAGGCWKFNKNTQSWLIRHMYQPDMVSKGTFNLLMEYLGGLPDGTARRRLNEDATRRACRYKEYERSSQRQQKDDGEKEESDKPEKGKEETSGDGTADDGLKQWEKLDDHDKRKEYKRARKVLELLQQDGNK